MARTLAVIAKRPRGIGVHQVIVVVATRHIVEQIRVRKDVTVQHDVPHVKRRCHVALQDESDGTIAVALNDLPLCRINEALTKHHLGVG